MITLRKLTLFYGSHTVLTDVNADWDGTGMLMLAGLNGSGKSTLLKTILGLLPYKGSLTLEGKEIRDLRPQQLARMFAYIPQSKPTPLHERAEDFLLLGAAHRLSLFEQPSEADAEQAEKALAMFHLERLRGTYLDELSGGEVQMLYTARCFVGERRLLILDEPCAGLDYHRQYLFLQTVKEKLAECGMGAILSIHDPNLACRFADRILFLHDKRLAWDVSVNTSQDKLSAAERFAALYGGAFSVVGGEEVFLQWNRI